MKVLLIQLLLFQSSILFCQEDRINWLMFHEAQDLNYENRLFGSEIKETFVFFYDANNSWCKRMRDEVFFNKELATYLNKNYIPVLWDINEYKREVCFATNHTYDNNEHKHNYVVYITGNRYSFPYSIILNKDNKIRLKIAGFITEKRLLDLIKQD